MLDKMLSVAIVLICGVVCVQAQQPKDKWQRVYTSEGFTTDIDPSTLRFEADKILSVQSRTIVAEPVSLQGNKWPKYKTALQTINFKLNTNQYRLSETVLLDAGEKVLLTSPASDWRSLKIGGAMESVLRVAEKLPPFGSWTVNGYRFATDAELEQFVGTPVRISSKRVDVGVKACLSPVFLYERHSKEEFVKKLGVEPSSIGISTDSIETINVKCETSGWRPPQSLLVKVAEGEMLMLWNGVFFVLKPESPDGKPLPSMTPSLIRREPTPP